jgi:hypothetical protein
MFAISIDVIRGIIAIRMRGTLSDALRDELVDQLRLAFDETPPVESRDWTLRVSAKPLAQYTPELAVRVNALVEERNVRRRSRTTVPPSRVVNQRVESGSAAARLVHFVTA